MERGPIIVLEGPDGSGKTTVAKEVARLLGERGYEVEMVRLPGGTRLGELLRGPLKDAAFDMSPTVKALLFVAVDQAGHEHAERAAAAGKAVVMDRCALSNLAYRMAQGEREVELFLQEMFGSRMGSTLRWWPQGAHIVMLDASDKTLQERVAKGKDVVADRFDGLWKQAAKAYRSLATRLMVDVVYSGEDVGPKATAMVVIERVLGQRCAPQQVLEK